MPYIIQSERDKLDPFIREIIEQIRALPEKDLTEHDGRLNYSICKLIIGVLDLVPNPKYHKWNTAMGVLSCVEKELYRRFVVAYEDQKISENGDIV